MRNVLRLVSLSVVALEFTLSVSGCGSAGGAEEPLPPAGTVLSESSRSMGHGFREIRRSQVNPPGHFEGIGHFAFVHFQDAQLCKCRKGEVAISPDGQFALYLDATGRLTLFAVATKSKKTLTDSRAGQLVDTAWHLSEHRAVVTLDKKENGQSTRSALVVSLQDDAP